MADFYHPLLSFHVSSQRCSTSMRSGNESDWEPLLETDAKSTSSSSSRRPPAGAGSGPGTCTTNRRDNKGHHPLHHHQEKCGRIKLGVLVALVFITFYLSLSTISIRPVVHQMVVTIPDDDEDLPGPRGKKRSRPT